MTTDDLFEELRHLDGKFVSVSFRPTGAWEGSVLHAQGRLRQNVVDQPEHGVAFGIGRPRRLNNDWAELEIMRDDVESAVWRKDLIANGRRALAVTLRGGGLLTIVPGEGVSSDPPSRPAGSTRSRSTSATPSGGSSG